LTDLSSAAVNASFTYDVLGRRIQKDVNGHTRKYQYDSEDILLELTAVVGERTRHIHGPGIDEPLFTETDGKLFFNLADGVSSILGLTDQAGNTIQRYDYSAFGSAEMPSGPDIAHAYRFTGREFDSETGLYYYRARYYNAESGRFIAEDPLTGQSYIPQTLNKYSYVVNNPLRYIDPNGEILLEATLTYIGVQALTVAAVYLITRSIVSVANAMNGRKSDLRKTNLSSVDDAFRYAAIAAALPALPIAITEASSILVPLALQNPVQTYEFLENSIGAGPPQPGTTFAPYISSGIGMVIERLLNE
jgi:RHS repeat-associated protein